MASTRLPLDVKKVEEGKDRQEINLAHIDFLENSLDQNVCLTSHILDLVICDPSHYDNHV